MFPTGGIVFWPSALLMPGDWLVCDGAPEDPMSVLGMLLGSRFGRSPAQEPLLPDMRGRFARGADANGTAGGPGAAKPSSFQKHTHNYEAFPVSTSSMIVDNDYHVHYFGKGPTATSTATPAEDVDQERAGLSNYETRAANVYMHFMIYAGGLVD